MSASVHLPRLHEPTGQTTHRWEIVVGTIQLFICGPGPDAWCPCSEPNYHRRGGTSAERAIARLALDILVHRHREDTEAGVPEIKAALSLARKQYQHRL